jgi:drug/metabolite transporter (DMT)-like permease
MPKLYSLGMALRRLLAYGAIYFLWGGSFLAIRDLVAIAPPFFSAGVRFLAAGLILYGVSRRRRTARPSRKEWINTALLGGAMFLGNYACLFWSSKYLPSGLASVLTALIPVWILLEEWLIFRMGRISAQAWTGVFLGIAGAGLIALPSGMTAGGLTRPSLVLVLGTLCWSIGTLSIPRLALPKDTGTSAGMQMAWGGLFLLVLSGGAGEFSQLALAWQRWSWQATVSMMYLIFAASIVAFTAYVWLVGREPASRVASCAYVNPVVALAVGYGIGHERPTLLQSFGAVLVVAGVFSTIAFREVKTETSLETAA